MAKSIIFDWSGVIKDSVKSHLWVVNRMFEKFGGNKISLEEMKENWQQPYMLFYNKYLPDFTMEDQKLAYRESIMHEDCPKSMAFPGIVEFIKKLKEEGNFLAVISSDFSDTIYPEIKSYGLENIFDEIIIDSYDKSKDLRDLIERKKLNLEDSFFIGDSNQEIGAARHVGAKSISVTWGFCTEQRLKSENPDFIVHNLKELEEILL